MTSAIVFFGVTKVSSAADADEPPANALQHSLTRQVITDRFESMIAISVAFHRDLGAGAAHDHVEPVSSYPNLGLDVVAGRYEITNHRLLEWRFSPGLGSSDTLGECLWISDVFDQSTPKVARLQIGSGIQRVHQPQLVPAPGWRRRCSAA